MPFPRGADIEFPMSDKSDKNWAGKAIAGAAIGSAALAAALLYAGKRKTAAERHRPRRPADAPETD